jgi:plastocyanin
MAQPQIFTFALLYSNSPIKDESDRQLFKAVRQTIQNDKILSKGIHFICIDNSHTRNLIQYNSTGVKVNSWPIFAVRNSKEKQPRLYPLCLAPMIFNHVYQLNNSFQSQASDNDCVRKQDWSIQHFKSGPGYIRLTPGEKIRFVSPSDEVQDLVEATPTWNIAANSRIDLRRKRRNGFDEEVLFDKVGVYHLISSCHPESMRLKVEVFTPDTDEDPDESTEHVTFPWNLTAFPSDGAGRELTVRYGNKLQLISTDNRTHNVTLNGKVLVPDQVGLKRILLIDSQTFKPGLNELVCTLHPNQMKLRLYVTVDQSEPNDLFDGMTLGSYDEPSNSKLRTFAQRQAARRDSRWND